MWILEVIDGEGASTVWDDHISGLCVRPNKVVFSGG